MPYVRIDTNVTLPPDKKAALAEELAKRIVALPGKPPERTMVEIDDGRTMYYGLSFEPCAKARVELFRHSPTDAKAEYGRQLTELLGTVAGIPADRVYLTFPEYAGWCSGGTLRVDEDF